MAAAAAAASTGGDGSDGGGGGDDGGGEKEVGAPSNNKSSPRGRGSGLSDAEGGWGEDGTSAGSLSHLVECMLEVRGGFLGWVLWALLFG